MSVGRRLIGWIAAYALVLQAMLAGIVATQALARANGAGAHGFELCLTDSDGSTLPGQRQHENCAMHCAVAGGLAALALALIAFIVFPPRRAPRVPPLVFRPTIDLLCRAGRSRAPPLPA
jgi:heme A synthase